MQATIQVTVKDVYGKELVYPVCDQAKRLADLVGSKTLTESTLRQWMAMGGRVEHVSRFGRPNARDTGLSAVARAISF